ncbi:MAG: aminopeptidase P N-terminal domain-containing protein, partial [Plesiomonas sp.]
MDIQQVVSRRQALLAQMVENSAAIFFAAPERTRSRDSDYPFRQNSDFWYFTTFNEPEAALILIKRDQKTQTILFNRVNDKLAEIWHGRRLGQQPALETLAVDEAFSYDTLEQTLPTLLT